MRHSEQRDVIYNVVSESCDHPNAETVLARAKSVMPSINIATVYRNLALLSEQKKILRITVEDGDRFDKTTYPHSHFHCIGCGKVFDIKLNELDCTTAKIDRLYDCTTTKVDIVVTGYCSSCKKEKR